MAILAAAVFAFVIAFAVRLDFQIKATTSSLLPSSSIDESRAVVVHSGRDLIVGGPWFDEEPSDFITIVVSVGMMVIVFK